MTTTREISITEKVYRRKFGKFGAGQRGREGEIASRWHVNQFTREIKESWGVIVGGGRNESEKEGKGVSFEKGEFMEVCCSRKVARNRVAKEKS